MLQNREQFNLEKLVSWSSYRKWADSIIAMSEEPPDDMTKASRRDDSRSERFRALLMMGFSLVVFVVTQAQQPSTKENPQQPTAATLAQLAQQNAGLRRIQAFRLTETIKIDGLLNEPAWSHAQPATDFLQERPIEGALASERTEVRVLFDDKNVYFGVRAFDSDTCRYQKTRFGQQDCKRQQFNASRRCDHHHTLPQHEVTARGNSR